MFFDIGSLEFITLIILAIMVFGPEKLPKMIREVTDFIRKVRNFSDNAKQDIRSELGPEFKDFEFEDLNPRNFARKHLLEKDEFGLRELANDLDVRKELTEVTDAVNGRTTRPAGQRPGANRPTTSLAKQRTGSPGTGGSGGAAGSVRLSKNGDAAGGTPPAEAPPFDADAT
ncbi:sec-independent translocase [Streptomyces sp. DSM 44915]|uniref:Sec-independent protein translocase protein TatB n=1 Tax=Streptomyces chisholmiae TaxID=3075540 RepID=A0ABU2JKM4_9ACTN|nr:sec-independent translocase [Streptomyces sp. DSM 44915]MDT0265462.1 sec-independent translocase [Streptomyces sp. DSM 44915]